MREFSSRARSGLVWGVIFLMVSYLGLVAAMETRRPELCDPEYGLRLARLRKHLADNTPGQALICAFGSSRVVMGFCPERMFASRPESAGQPIAFNFGAYAGGAGLELCYLRRLLADGVRPDWVFAEVWPPYLYQGQDVWAEEKRMEVVRLQRRDLAVFSWYSARPRSLYWKWFKCQVLPWFTHRYFLLSLYAPDWLPIKQRLDPAWREMDRWGWMKTPGAEPDPSTRQQLFTQGRQILTPALDHFQVGDATNRALRELVALCYQGIVLIFLPESSQCRSWYPPAAQNQVDEYLRRLSGECGVLVVNARSWIPDWEFFDGYHLTNKGAASFSEQLEQRVLQPLLSGRCLAPDELWPGTHSPTIE